MDRFLLAVVMQVLTVFWFVVTIILTTRLWLLSLVDAMQRGKWSKPQRIDCGDYPETESVALASDDHGNVFAMSQQRDKVFVRRFTEANGWSMAEAIGDATYVISSTSITCDVHGIALAVWHAGHRDHAETWINRYTIRNGWGKAERFDCSPGEKSPVNIVGDAQGHAIAVWFHNRNGRSLILCKRYMPDTGWSEATTVAESDRLINTLKLIGDRQGRCFILWDWQQNKSGKGEYTYNGVVPVYASYYTATNGWSYATKIADDVLYDKVDRLVAELDNLGNVIVVWAHQVYKAGNDRADIWAVRYDVVNGWDKASAIEPGIEGRSENKSESAWPKIAFDSAGNTLVVWQQDKDTQNGRIWSYRYTVGNIMTRKVTWHIRVISLLLLLTGSSSAMSKNDAKFEWGATESAPKHYPMKIIRGTFIYHGEAEEGLYIPSGGTLKKGWGQSISSHSVGERLKPLSDRLMIIFFSYVEEQFYKGYQKRIFLKENREWEYSHG